MASFSHLSTLIFFSFFIILLIINTSSSSASSDNYNTNNNNNNNNVTVSIYYETLCPYCADFIVNHLSKVFDNGLISIINLRLVPWGNAFTQQNGTVSCQHGPDECFLNTIDACTITIYPDAHRHFRFVRCIEQKAMNNKIKEWTNCFDMSGLGKVPIDCYKSGYGNSLDQKFAKETSQLNPPHRFVPWVVVNNQALQEDFENFMSYICKAYQGPQLPDTCRSVQITNESLEMASITDKVCYTN
ncbi:hypothetical protein ACFE04_002630 [Oxalis oulophora]